MSTEFPEPFDPSAQKGSDYALIPPGEYTAQVIEAKVAPPSTGDGQMLTLVWKIIEGEHENRQVWQNIAFLHSSTQAVEIGRRMLTDLCNALGIAEHITDAAVFLFKPARIRLKIQKSADGYYGNQNRVTRIVPLESAGETAKPKPASGVAPKPAGNVTARPGQAGTAPWHDNR